MSSPPALAPLAKLDFRHARRPGNERPGNMGQNRPFGQVCGRVAQPMVQERTVKNKNTSGIKRNIVSEAKIEKNQIMLTWYRLQKNNGNFCDFITNFSLNVAQLLFTLKAAAAAFSQPSSDLIFGKSSKATKHASRMKKSKWRCLKPFAIFAR